MLRLYYLLIWILHWSSYLLFVQLLKSHSRIPKTHLLSLYLISHTKEPIETEFKFHFNTRVVLLRTKSNDMLWPSSWYSYLLCVQLLKSHSRIPKTHLLSLYLISDTKEPIETEFKFHFNTRVVLLRTKSNDMLWPSSWYFSSFHLSMPGGKVLVFHSSNILQTKGQGICFYSKPFNFFTLC